MIDFSQAPIQKTKKFRPEKAPEDPIQAFHEAMIKYGLKPDSIDISGKLIRFDIDKKNDNAGWYIFYYGDLCAGAFGNWKTGLNEKWCNIDTQSLTDGQVKEYQEKVREAKRQREEQEKIDQEEARVKAVKLWNDAQSASQDHPYLVEKGIKSYGLKQVGDNLIIPSMDENGAVWSYCWIFPDGTKRFESLGRRIGLSFTIQGNENLYLCEGYATGASIHEATGGTVIICFNRSNLISMARIVKDKCPLSNITICADNDFKTLGNPGMEDGKKAAQLINANFAFPTFRDLSSSPTDFNDLHKLEGLDAVREQIHKPGQKSALQPLKPDQTQTKGRLLQCPAPMSFIFHFNDIGLVPKGIVGVLAAAGGTGKTFFLLSLAYAGASASNFGPINAKKKLRTLVLAGEDSQDELDRRLWNIGKGAFPDYLHAASVYGELGPIMRLEGSTPKRADTYYWLDETLKNHENLDLLIIDPKSRFYGLDENNNDHATQWIQSLESLAKKYETTIIFSHHTGKENASKMSQNMGRGASAIVDGCRWQGGLIRMTPDTAKTLNIDNPRQFIIFDAPKSNYAEDMPSYIYFKRCKHGVLEYCDPWNDYMGEISKKLLDMLMNDPTNYTRRELMARDEGKEIFKELKDKFPNFARKNMDKVIDYLVNGNELEEKEIATGNGFKKVLVPKIPF